MNYTGKVHNGVVVLSPGTRLPEGTEVEVTPHEVTAHEDPFLAAVLKTTKPRPDWPKDYALNHSHYTRGEPKKS